MDAPQLSLKQPRKSPKRITYELAYKTRVALEQVCKKGDDGYAEYQKGWDDEKVAQLVSVPIATVRTIRQQVMGLVRKPTFHPGTRSQLLVDLVNRVNDITHRLEQLEDGLGVKNGH
jgi:hypothetical protein